MTKRTVKHDVWVEYESIENPHGRRVIDCQHPRLGFKVKATLTIELPEREKLLKESEVKIALAASCDQSLNAQVDRIFSVSHIPAPKKHTTVNRRDVWRAFLGSFTGSTDQLSDKLDNLFGEI